MSKPSDPRAQAAGKIDFVREALSRDREMWEHMTVNGKVVCLPPRQSTHLAGHFAVLAAQLDEAAHLLSVAPLGDPSFALRLVSQDGETSS